MKDLTQPLRTVSSDELIGQTRSLVGEERRISLEILKHLREVERRRLYATLGYSSMFVFCVRELKYSEGAASRRLNSMRLLVEIPEIEPELASGTLQLSTVSQVQSFCFAQKRENGVQITTEEKRAILRTIENRSKRETEQILTAISPKPLTSERERILDPEHTEIRIVAGESLLQKLKRIEALWAHRQKNHSYGELLELMADQLLDRIDPLRKSASVQTTNSLQSGTSTGGDLNSDTDLAPSSSHTGLFSSLSPVEAGHPNSGRDSSMRITSSQEDSPPLGLRIRGGGRGHSSREGAAHRPYISAGIRLAVWRRDQGRCTYTNPQTGQKCGETRALQLDHILPVAKGGASTLENLRLLCRTHNTQAAIQEFGSEHMSAYLKN